MEKRVINMNLNDKLELWVEITGINPNEKKTKWVITPNRLSDWDIEKMNKNLKYIMEHTNTVMTEIVLRYYFLQFLKDRTFSLYDLINDNESNELLQKCKLLMMELSVTKEEEELKERTKNALDFYGKDVDIQDIDMFDVVSMYVSAKTNMENLRTVQFKRGKKSKIKPRFSKEIYMFHSIDEVIEGVNTIQENAVMLCYIHDNETPESSYFCYVAKNEENIYLIGDMPDYEHPYQKYLTRCPSRKMEDRINSNFFPYSMSGLDLSDRYKVNDSKSLDDNFKQLGTFASMELSELLWNIYMLEFIKEKFFDNNFDCKELSYTGNMLQNPLITKNETTLAIYNQFPVLDIPLISDIGETDNLIYGTRNIHESEHIFKDLIDRFSSQVNIMDCQIYDKGDITKLIIDKDSFGNEITTNLLNMNTEFFGTKDEIERNQKWTTRFNYAVKINQLAKEEYNRTRNEVETWYRNIVMDKLPVILEKAIKGELRGKPRTIYNGIVRIVPQNPDEDISIVEKKLLSDVYGTYFFPKNTKAWRMSEYKCLLSDAKGTICLTINPSRIEEICTMLDISLDEVPVQIRDWTSQEKYIRGNYLLDDYDPMDWVIKDYWYDTNFGVALVLSKSAYNKKRKEYGLPEDKFWNTGSR